MSTRKPRAATAKVLRYIDDSDDEEFEARINKRVDMKKSKVHTLTDEDDCENEKVDSFDKSPSNKPIKKTKTPEKNGRVVNENVLNRAAEVEGIEPSTNDARKNVRRERKVDSSGSSEESDASFESDSDVSLDDEESVSETESESEEETVQKKSKGTPKISGKKKPSTPAASSHETKKTPPKASVLAGKMHVPPAAASKQFVSDLPASSSSVAANMIVENPVDITRGPPINTENGAIKLIKEYMKLQNRPYSAVQIFDNLHKRIQKSSVEKILARLAREEDRGTGHPTLCEKEYGKAKIYYYNQAQLPSLNPSEMANLDSETAVLNNELKGSELQTFEAKVKVEKLLQEPTDDELDKALKEAEARVELKKRKTKGKKQTRT